MRKYYIYWKHYLWISGQLLASFLLVFEVFQQFIYVRTLRMEWYIIYKKCSPWTFMVCIILWNMYSCTPQNAKIGYTLLNRICNTLKLLVSVAYTRAYESVMMVQASMKPFSSHRISACVSFFILIFLLSFFASTHARSLPQIWRSIEEAFYFLPKIGWSNVFAKTVMML